MGELQVGVALYGGVGDAVVVCVLSHNAEKIARGKETNSCPSDVLFIDQLQLIGAHQTLIGAAAVEITACFQRESGGFGRV